MTRCAAKTEVGIDETRGCTARGAVGAMFVDENSDRKIKNKIWSPCLPSCGINFLKKLLAYSELIGRLVFWLLCWIADISRLLFSGECKKLSQSWWPQRSMVHQIVSHIFLAYSRFESFWCPYIIWGFTYRRISFLALAALALTCVWFLDVFGRWKIAGHWLPNFDVNLCNGPKLMTCSIARVIWIC